MVVGPPSPTSSHGSIILEGVARSAPPALFLRCKTSSSSSSSSSTATRRPSLLPGGTSRRKSPVTVWRGGRPPLSR
eukprot:4199848-Prymnesium_polylepis.1